MSQLLSERVAGEVLSEEMLKILAGATNLQSDSFTELMQYSGVH